MSQEKKTPKISTHGQPYAKATSISARLGQLQFHRSGKFRVVQVADLQEGPRVCADTIHLLGAMCDIARPDIVIFTGNQIAGYNRAFAPTYRSRRWPTLEDGVFSPLKENNIKKLALSPGSLTHSVKQEGHSNINYAQAVEYTRKLVIQQAEQFLKPLMDRGIPFAITYGNHDFQCGLSNEELDDIYRTFSNCVNPLRVEDPLLKDREVARHIKDYAAILPHQECTYFSTGTFTLPVLDVERKNVIAALTLVNSGDYSLEGGYGGPSYEVLNWLRESGSVEGVKPLVFQHFPIEKMYSLLKVVPPETAYSVRGYPPYEKKSFILDPAKTQKDDYLGEAISMCARGKEEFDILKNHYIGLFAGHDHRNGFVGRIDGVLLGTTPTAGFGSYGPPPSRRAVRYIEFDIRHPEAPRTELLEFGDLVGQTKSRSAYTFSLLEKNSLAVGSNGFAERSSDSAYQQQESNEGSELLVPPRILSKTNKYTIDSIKSGSRGGSSLESQNISQENDRNVINRRTLHQQEKEMLIRDLRAAINEVKTNF